MILFIEFVINKYVAALRCEQSQISDYRIGRIKDACVTDILFEYKTNRVWCIANEKKNSYRNDHQTHISACCFFGFLCLFFFFQFGLQFSVSGGGRESQSGLRMVYQTKYP